MFHSLQKFCWAIFVSEYYQICKIYHRHGKQTRIRLSCSFLYVIPLESNSAGILLIREKPTFYLHITLTNCTDKFRNHFRLHIKYIENLMINLYVLKHRIGLVDFISLFQRTLIIYVQLYFHIMTQNESVMCIIWFWDSQPVMYFPVAKRW